MNISCITCKKQRQYVHKANMNLRRATARDEIIAAMKAENSLPKYQGVMVFLDLDIPVIFELTDLVSEKLRLTSTQKLEAFKDAAMKYQGAFFRGGNDRPRRLQLFAETLISEALAAAGSETAEEALSMERFRAFLGSFSGRLRDFSPEEAFSGINPEYGRNPGHRLCMAGRS